MQEINNQYNIVFFDGECILCNKAVDFLLEHDKNQCLKYASLQSSTARQLGIYRPADEKAPGSVIFLQGDRQYTRSDAVIRISQQLGFPWNLMVIGRIVPTRLRNMVYDLVAGNRYRWFGKRAACRVADEFTKGRILE